MGCFSFKCLECGRGIRSSSFSGEKCHLFLLKDGKIIQQMTGEYDSYGRVFKDGTQDSTVKHSLRESDNWKPVSDDVSDRDSWSQVCDLMHDENIQNGIAAIHVHCFKSNPEIQSVSDPNQGWGEPTDDEDDLMGNIEGEGTEYKPLTPIPNYDARKDHEIEKLGERMFRIKHEIPNIEAYTKLYEGEKYSVLIEMSITKLDSLKKELKDIENRLKDLK